jgi:hypothetical protein
VAGHAPVGVDDDLPARKPRVALRAADDEATGRVDVDLGVGIEQVAGMAASMTSARMPSASSRMSTSGSCWALTNTVWTRAGRPSSSYSTVTWLLPSGRRNGSEPSRRASASRRAVAWASWIGIGISSGVSSVA